MKRNGDKDNLEKVNQELLEESRLSEIDTIEEAQEILDKLPDEEKIMIARKATMVSYQGPIPHPSMLKAFNEINDSFANRILEMAENEQKHLIDRDKQIIKYAGRETTLSLILSFITILILLFMTTLFVLYDKKFEGFVMIVPTLAVIIKAYTKQKDKEK